MSSSTRDLSRRLRSVANTIEDSVGDASRAAAAAAKATFLTGGKAARIPSKHRWGARYTVGRGRDLGYEAAVFYTGAAPSWTEHGTKPHVIVSRKLGGGKKARQESATILLTGNTGRARTGQFGRRGALLMRDGNFRAYARHPGARKRPFFAAVRTTVQRQTQPIFRTALARSMTKGMR